MKMGLVEKVIWDLQKNEIANFSLMGHKGSFEVQKY